MPSRSSRHGHVRAAVVAVALVAVAGGILVGSAPAARANGTILTPLADGFDFPVGKPDAAGYYKARGFWPNGHLGEDWNGRGGGNTDLGDPVYNIADGVVVASDDYRKGWGNCVIVRHAYRDKAGKIRMIDSLYAHLDRRSVRKFQIVRRGQQLGTIGTNRGMYYAHLHFELRKNLSIGMNRTKFARDYSNYFSPTPFIEAHRRLRTSSRRIPVPVRTFAPYGEDLPERTPSIRAESDSVVPIPAPDSGDGGTRGLKPELREIIERTRPDEADDDDEGFWKRLREKLRLRRSPAEGEGE